MSQEGSGQAGNALLSVARFRVGRILMWILAIPFLSVGSLGFIPVSRQVVPDPAAVQTTSLVVAVWLGSPRVPVLASQEKRSDELSAFAATRKVTVSRGRALAAGCVRSARVGGSLPPQPAAASRSTAIVAKRPWCGRARKGNREASSLFGKNVYLS
ncbi:hypothetical protein SAMN05444354_101175 [Stigmatella aurantiaca]|uniref:Uncharacterized protein n=1 Tax=Stigmatella aurantiaca TaxID=41 RepID=A0A1H7FPV3_STIAU|nr:hypothetical protein SAMN05444354_101175 [Stigmatella aurantiaca]